jgi:hypothetical protein
MEDNKVLNKIYDLIMKPFRLNLPKMKNFQNNSKN